MNRSGTDKVAALAAIREKLGSRITSGSELLQVQETRKVRAATGLAGLNEQLGGGLPKGHFTEILSGDHGGGGLVMAALLAGARRKRQYVMLFDVGCCFSPESFPEPDLEGLLWVGCSGAGEAVEALDVASRDENFSLFFVDLRGSSSSDWRGVRANQWQRILGQLRQRESVAILFANEAVTSASKHRIRVDLALQCEDLDRDREQLFARLRFETARGLDRGAERLSGGTLPIRQAG